MKGVIFSFLVVLISVVFYKQYQNVPVDKNTYVITKEVAEDLVKLQATLPNHIKLRETKKRTALDNLKGCLEGVTLPNTSTCIPHIAKLAEQFAQMTTEYTIAKRTEQPSFGSNFQSVDNIDFREFSEIEDENIDCSQSEKGLCGLFNKLLSLDNSTHDYDDKNSTYKRLKKFYEKEKEINVVQFRNIIASISPWLQEDVNETQGLFYELFVANSMEDFSDNNISARCEVKAKDLWSQFSVWEKDSNVTQCLCVNTENDKCSKKKASNECSRKLKSDRCNIEEKRFKALSTICKKDENTTKFQCLKQEKERLRAYYVKLYYLAFEQAYEMSYDGKGTNAPRLHYISLMDDIQTLSKETQQWLGIDSREYNATYQYINETIPFLETLETRNNYKTYLQDLGVDENTTKKYLQSLGDDGNKTNNENISFGQYLLHRETARSFIDRQRNEFKVKCSSPFKVDNGELKPQSVEWFDQCNDYFNFEIKYGEFQRYLHNRTALEFSQYKAAKKAIDNSLIKLEKIIDQNKSFDKKDKTEAWKNIVSQLSFVGEAAKKLYDVTDNVVQCDTNKSSERLCSMPIELASKKMQMEISTYPIEQINEERGQYAFSKSVVEVSFDKSSSQALLRKKTAVSFLLTQELNERTVKDNNGMLFNAKNYASYDFGPKMILDANVTVRFADKNVSKFLENLCKFKDEEVKNKEKFYKTHKKDSDVFVPRANPYVITSKINIEFPHTAQWYGHVQSKVVEDFLSELNLQNGIQVDTSHMGIDNNNMILTVNLSLERFADAPNVIAKFNLTSGDSKEWAQTLDSKSDEVIKSFLKVVNNKISDNETVERWLNPPETMHVAGVSLASKEPLRFNVLAYPEDNPSLLTTFSLNDRQWDGGALLFPASTAFAVQQEKVDNPPSIQTLIQGIFDTNYTTPETLACLGKVESIYKNTIENNTPIQKQLGMVRKTVVDEANVSAAINNVFNSYHNKKISHLSKPIIKYGVKKKDADEINSMLDQIIFSRLFVETEYTDTVKNEIKGDASKYLESEGIVDQKLLKKLNNQVTKRVEDDISLMKKLQKQIVQKLEKDINCTGKYSEHCKILANEIISLKKYKHEDSFQDSITLLMKSPRVKVTIHTLVEDQIIQEAYLSKELQTSTQKLSDQFGEFSSQSQAFHQKLKKELTSNEQSIKVEKLAVEKVQGDKVSFNYIVGLSAVVPGLTRVPKALSTSIDLTDKNLSNQIKQLEKTSNKLREFRNTTQSFLEEKIEETLTEDGNISTIYEKFKDACEQSDLDAFGIECSSPQKFYKSIIKDGKDPISFFRREASRIAAGDDIDKNLTKACVNQFESFDYEWFGLLKSEKPKIAINATADKICQEFKDGLDELKTSDPAKTYKRLKMKKDKVDKEFKELEEAFEKLNQQALKKTRELSEKIAYSYYESMMESQEIKAEEEYAEYFTKGFKDIYKENINQLNEFKVSYEQRTYGVCVKRATPFTARAVLKQSDCNTDEEFSSDIEDFKDLIEENTGMCIKKGAPYTARVAFNKNCDEPTEVFYKDKDSLTKDVEKAVKNKFEKEYSEELELFNTARQSFKEKTYGMCIKKGAPYTVRPVLKQSDCNETEAFYKDKDRFIKDVEKVVKNRTKQELDKVKNKLKNEYDRLVDEGMNEVCASIGLENNSVQSSQLTCKNIRKWGSIDLKSIEQEFKKEIKEAKDHYVDTLKKDVDEEVDKQLMEACTRLNELVKDKGSLRPLFGEAQLSITLPSKCPSSSQGFKFTLDNLPLKTEHLEITSGIHIDMDVKELRKGADAVKIEWEKLKFEPSLEEVINREFAFDGDYLTLNEIRPVQGGLKVMATLRPKGYPLSIPVNLGIDKDGGFHIRSIDLKGTVLSSACTEIDKFFQKERLELFDGAQILGAPQNYCVERKLKGIELKVEAAFPKPVGKQPLKVFLDFDKGIRIEKPSNKQLFMSAGLKALGIEGLTPREPFYTYDNGLTLFFDGSIDTPIGAALDFGFKVSPKKFDFLGDIKLAIPGWYATPNGIDFGDASIGFDPAAKNVTFEGSMAFTPGQESSKLFRVDGVATIGIKDGMIVLKGGAKLLRFIELMSAKTMIYPKAKLFKMEINSNPLLAGGIAINGLMKIEDNKPNPYLVVDGKGELFGASIADMTIKLDNDLSGEMESSLRFPLKNNGLSFKVEAEKHFKNLRGEASLDRDIEVVKVHVGLKANEDYVEANIGFKKPLKTDVEIEVPSLSVLTPAKLLSLLKGEIKLDIPDSINISLGGSQDEEKDNDMEVAPMEKKGGDKLPDDKVVESQSYNQVNSIPIVPAAKRIETTIKVCKKKLGVFKDCHDEPRIKHEYTNARFGRMGSDTGFRSEESMYRNNIYIGTDSGFEFLIENPDKLNPRMHVFYENGARIWSGTYNGDAKKIMTKVVTSIGHILVTENNEKICIVSENTSYNECEEIIKNGSKYAKKDNLFGKAILQTIAEKRVGAPNKRQVVDVVTDFKDAGKWALLQTSGKDAKTFTLVNHNPRKGRPDIIAFDVITSMGKENNQTLVPALTKNYKYLDKLFEKACPNKESSILNTCGTLMVNSNKGWVFGIEEKRDKKQLNHNTYWSKGEKHKDPIKMIMGGNYTNDEIKRASHKDLFRLKGKAMNDLIDGTMTEFFSAKKDVKEARFNYGHPKGYDDNRMGFYYLDNTKTPHLGIIAGDVKSKDGKPYKMLKQKFTTLKQYYQKGVKYADYKKGSPRIWLQALTWPETFESLDFKSDPMVGFYQKRKKGK